MSETGTTTCTRHPSVETRLSCSSCGTPICPRCAVPTSVGQKCPGCARQPRSARRQGKPDQYAKAIVFGLVGAGMGAFVLTLVLTSIGLFTWIAAGLVGFGVAGAVRRGAEGNGSDPFRYLAYGAAVLAVLVTFLYLARTPLPGLRNAITYLAAVYGAHLRFR